MTIAGLERLYSSASATIAVGRQRAQGVPRTQNLYKLRSKTPNPALPSDLLDPGIEVGSGTITAQRKVKSSFKPMFSFDAHLRPGVLMNGLLACDYSTYSLGEDAALPAPTTLAAAVLTRHSRVATLTSVADVLVGDWLQIGALLTVPPTLADKCEVHEVVSKGATNAVQRLTINDGVFAGTYKLRYGGQTTAAIAYNALAATIQGELVGLPSIGAGNVTVTGAAGGPYTITFISGKAALNVDLITVVENLLVNSINEEQTVTLALATGGTFRLSYGGTFGVPIAFDAAAAAVEASLEGIVTIGPGGVSVTGAAGGPYTVEFTGKLAGRKIALLRADVSGLVGVGATVTVAEFTTGSNPGRRASASVTEVTAGCGAAQVAFRNCLLYKYPNGTAVKRCDPTKSVEHYHLHVQPDDNDNGGGDLFTVYARWSNGTDVNEVMIIDCNAASFGASFANGQIASGTTEWHGLKLVRNPEIVAAVNVLPDPVSYPVQNTRGSFSMLGDEVNAPRSFGVTVTTERYDDQRLTKYELQGQTHLGHTMVINADGPFLKNFYEQANFGSPFADTVVDTIPESAMLWTLQAGFLVGQSTRFYEFTMNAPEAQFSNYDVTLNTNQVADGRFGSIEVVPEASTGRERWYYHTVNNCTTDVYSAASA